MPDNTQELTPPDQPSLNVLLAEYIAADEAGQPLDRDAYLASHPQHAADLRDFFAHRDQIQRLASPLCQIATEALNAVHPPPPMLGQIQYFGDYELLEETARGGMGIVYKARQVSLNRTVAVKMILRGTLATEDDVRRFRAEAEASASLQHPGIVAIHEIGVCEGQHYFSMDFVQGQNLSQRIREQPLSSRQVAVYLHEAAEAVHYAHQQGTLHRDLKPSNILIDNHDRVRVTDFGLAVRIEGNSDLTLTGQILGTPSYMSPEQARGKRSLISATCDVYSLGAVLYELLTGRPPFRGETPMETLRQVETLDPVAPRLLCPGISRDLETICLKCLEKEPHRRYGTAKLLANDLARFLKGDAISAHPTRYPALAWRWCRRKPAHSALALCVLLLLAGGAAAAVVIEQLSRRDDDRSPTTKSFESIAVGAMASPTLPPTIANIPAREIRRFYTGEQKVIRLAVSSGGALAASVGTDGTVRLWDLKSGLESKRLGPHFIQSYAVAFSPDGLQIASGGEDHNLFLWDVALGKKLNSFVGHQGNVCGLSFSSDGKRVASGSWDRTIRIWDVETAKETIKLEGHTAAITGVAFAPDGRQLASAGTDRTVRIWDTSSGKLLHTLEGHEAIVRAVDFSPDGKLVLSGAHRGDGTARLWNADTGEQVLQFGNIAAGIHGVAYSPTEPRAIIVGADRAELWNLQTGTIEQTFGSLKSATDAVFLPDGQHALLASPGDTTLRLWRFTE